MAAKTAVSGKHLEWLVESRSRNQRAALKLLTLIRVHRERLENDEELGADGITLIAICFCLWRAVFLAERTGSHGASLEHATTFLETLINDNAIAYTQDKNAREWTYVFYLNNARYRLEGLSTVAKQILPNFPDPTDFESLETWEHYQSCLEVAIGNFGNFLKRPKQR